MLIMAKMMAMKGGMDMGMHGHIFPMTVGVLLVVYSLLNMFWPSLGMNNTLLVTGIVAVLFGMWHDKKCRMMMGGT